MVQGGPKWEGGGSGPAPPPTSTMERKASLHPWPLHQLSDGGIRGEGRDRGRAAPPLRRPLHRVTGGDSGAGVEGGSPDGRQCVRLAVGPGRDGGRSGWSCASAGKAAELATPRSSRVRGRPPPAVGAVRAGGGTQLGGCRLSGVPRGTSQNGPETPRVGTRLSRDSCLHFFLTGAISRPLLSQSRGCCQCHCPYWSWVGVRGP